MSYQSQTELGRDEAFVSRSRAALINQSAIYKDDARGDIKSLAEALLRGDGGPTIAFLTLLPAAPGFADNADNGDGTVDSSRISDPDILAAVQAEWPTVAALYFGPDGTPIT